MRIAIAIAMPLSVPRQGLARPSGGPWDRCPDWARWHWAAQLMAYSLGPPRVLAGSEWLFLLRADLYARGAFG